MRAVKRRIRYPGCAFILALNLVLVNHCTLLPVKIRTCTPVSVNAVLPRQEKRGSMNTTMSP